MSERTERIILLLAAILIVLFSYFLYDDSLLFPRNETSVNESVGTVSLKGRDIRLKRATAFTWVPAEPSASVSLYDSVFTGENSSAQILLKNGAKLELEANSLITLKDNEGSINLDLRYGDVTTQLGSAPIKISTGKETISLEGSGKVVLKRTPAGSIDVSVNSGQVNVRSKSGSQSIAPGKSLRVEAGTTRSLEVGSFQLNPFPEGRFLKAKKSDPLAFSWSGFPKAASYDLQLCDSENCQRPLARKTFPQPAGNIRTPLEAGRYFWKVEGRDAKNRLIAKSNVLPFELEIASAPRVTTPPENTELKGLVKVRKLTVPPTASTTIQWDPQSLFDRYEYRLAKDPGFRAPVAKETTPHTAAATPPLTNGIYYYHVRGVLKDGRSTDWSETNSLNVDLTPTLGEEPGRVAFEKKRYELDADLKKSRSPSSLDQTVVRWSPAPRAAAYKVELSKSPSFRNARAFTVKGTSFAWENTPPGTWHARVQAISKDEVAGPFSPPSTLHILSGKPVLEPLPRLQKTAASKNAPAPAITTEARWTSVPTAAAYRVEVAKSPDFTDARQLTSRKPASEITLNDPGTYFIRVQGLDRQGEPATNFSEPKSVEYSYRHPLEAPRLAEPYDKASIFLQRTENPMFWLEWESVPQAAAYDVEIATDPQFSNVIFSTRSRESRILLQNKVPVGTFHWRVRSRNLRESRESGWSESRSFSIDSQTMKGFEL